MNLKKAYITQIKKMLKVKEKVKEVYECQINSNYLNYSLTDMRSNLTEFEVRKNKVRMAEKLKNQNQSKHEITVRREKQLLFSEELSIKAVNIECTHKVKAYVKEQAKTRN